MRWNQRRWDSGQSQVAISVKILPCCTKEFQFYTMGTGGWQANKSTHLIRKCLCTKVRWGKSKEETG